MHAGDTAAEQDEHLPDIDWTVPPQGGRRTWFTAPSGPLAVLSAGAANGPRVVLVPGVTGSKEDFAFQLPELAAAGYLAQSFDLAGQYESRRAGPEHLDPARPHYDWDLFAGDLLAFLEAGRTPAHLVGYSFGGPIAELVAVRRPDLVASLTLLSAPPLTGQAFRGIRRMGPFTGLAPAWLIALLMEVGLLLNVQGVPAGRQRFVRRRFRFTRPSSQRDVMALMKNLPDLDDELAALPLPKAVAVGEDDLWPLALHAAFARRIGATMAVYRTGHSPCETAPHQLSRDLLALFDNALLPS